MPKRIPPAVFWVVLVAVVFGLGYSLFTAMQPEETASTSTSPPAVATSAPSSAPLLAARSAAAGATANAGPKTAASSPQTAGRPSETVALAPRGPQANLSSTRRWAGDGDFTYSGRWEHITGHYDGRTNGSSSRSFRPGSQARLSFDGRFVRLYGVVGPGGGLGTVEIDGKVKRMVDFYGATKAVHTLVFSSPPLAPGPHRLTLSVIPDQALPAERAHFVNIDGAEFGS